MTAQKRRYISEMEEDGEGLYLLVKDTDRSLAPTDFRKGKTLHQIAVELLPLMFQTDPYIAHVQAVQATGVDPPSEWTALHERLQDFLTGRSSISQRLASAIIDDSDEDLDVLRAAALAETTAFPPAHASVNAAVKHVVLQRLKHIYGPVALINYRTIASEFDSLATKFTAVAHVIDPETPAEQLVHAPEKLRKAWSTAEQLAHQLTETMAQLSAAASLNGVTTTQQEQLLALVCDPNGLHRRRVWEAWSSTGGRCGRWAALTALGAAIKAHDLDGFEEYRKPAPMKVKQVRVGVGIRQVEVDPEDELLQTAAR